MEAALLPPFCLMTTGYLSIYRTLQEKNLYEFFKLTSIVCDSSRLIKGSYNPNFEKNLKEELYGCHKNMGFSMSELLNMPIFERHTFIKVHNKITEEEKKRIDERMKH